MIVCAFFWLLALVLVAKLWTPSAKEIFSWDERVIGSIVVFMPILGALFWFLYFRRPSSHRPENILGGTTTGLGHKSAGEVMRIAARHNASFPGHDIWIPEGVKKCWFFLRWPFFAGLEAGVVWFNAMLLQ